MSLKALARERLAIIRGGETEAETRFTSAHIHKAPVKHAEAQKTAQNEACFTVSPLSGGNDETSFLPPDIEAGLKRLQTMQRPFRLTVPQEWEEVLSDASRLVREGWAAKALALGWHPFHLFGCSPKVGGDVEQEGLAVRLAGAKLLLLDETTAVFAPCAHDYRVFNVRPVAGAVYLWELGSF